jgi:hypothetical protein
MPNIDPNVVTAQCIGQQALVRIAHFGRHEDVEVVRHLNVT